MSFTEEEIKRAADLKLWIESRIGELDSEISKLKQTLLVVDSVLRAASFRPASEFPVGASVTGRSEEIAVVASREEAVEEVKETRQLTRAKDGRILGSAQVLKARVIIAPAEDVKLTSGIPPFKSFFVNRILEGMKAKDTQLVSQGKLKSIDMIRYQIEEEGGTIMRVVIENYREKLRLNEIVNTATWVFSRMLEKEDRAK